MEKFNLYIFVFFCLFFTTNENQLYANQHQSKSKPSNNTNLYLKLDADKNLRPCDVEDPSCFKVPIRELISSHFEYDLLKVFSDVTRSINRNTVLGCGATVLVGMGAGFKIWDFLDEKIKAKLPESKWTRRCLRTGNFVFNMFIVFDVIQNSVSFLFFKTADAVKLKSFINDGNYKQGSAVNQLLRFIQSQNSNQTDFDEILFKKEFYSLLQDPLVNTLLKIKLEEIGYLTFPMFEENKLPSFLKMEDGFLKNYAATLLLRSSIVGNSMIADPILSQDQTWKEVAGISFTSAMMNTPTLEKLSTFPFLKFISPPMKAIALKNSVLLASLFFPEFAKSMDYLDMGVKLGAAMTCIAATRSLGMAGAITIQYFKKAKQVAECVNAVSTVTATTSGPPGWLALTIKEGTVYLISSYGYEYALSSWNHYYSKFQLLKEIEIASNILTSHIDQPDEEFKRSLESIENAFSNYNRFLMRVINDEDDKDLFLLKSLEEKQKILSIGYDKSVDYVKTGLKKFDFLLENENDTDFHTYISKVIRWEVTNFPKPDYPTLGKEAELNIYAHLGEGFNEIYKTKLLMTYDEVFAEISLGKFVYSRGKNKLIEDLASLDINPSLESQNTINLYLENLMKKLGFPHLDIIRKKTELIEKQSDIIDEAKTEFIQNLQDLHTEKQNNTLHRIKIISAQIVQRRMDFFKETFQNEIKANNVESNNQPISSLLTDNLLTNLNIQMRFYFEIRKILSDEKKKRILSDKITSVRSNYIKIKSINSENSKHSSIN